MKIRNNTVDEIFYYIMCLVSFGGVWLMRVVISEAIRKAFESND